MRIQAVKPGEGLREARPQNGTEGEGEGALLLGLSWERRLGHGGGAAGALFPAAAQLFCSRFDSGGSQLQSWGPGGLTRSLGVGPRGHRAASAPAAHTSACLSSVAEVLSECRLLAYISQVPTQMSFLFRLINIIHVQTLTQVRGLQTCPQERGIGKLPSSRGHLHPRSTSPVTQPFIPRRPPSYSEDLFQ